MSIKDRLKSTLYAIRNPERNDDEAEFNRQLGFKRLFFLLPFIIAAVIVLLLAIK